jgi:hypothetical protein
MLSVPGEMLMPLVVSSLPSIYPAAFGFNYSFGCALVGAVCVAGFPWNEGGYHGVLESLDFCPPGGAVGITAPSVREGAGD